MTKELEVITSNAQELSLTQQDSNMQATLIGSVKELIKSDKFTVEVLDKLMSYQQVINDKASEREFYTDFARLQAQIPPVKMTGKSNRGIYATLSDIENTVKQPLKDCGFSLLSTLKDEMVKTTIFHKSGYSIFTEISISGVVFGQIPGIQGLGAGLSYARRYNIINLLNICTTDDNEDVLEDRSKSLAEANQKAEKKAEKIMKAKLLSFIEAVEKSDSRDAKFGAKGGTLQIAFDYFKSEQQEGKDGFLDAIKAFNEKFNNETGENFNQKEEF